MLGQNGDFIDFFAFMPWSNYQSWYSARGTFLVFIKTFMPKNFSYMLKLLYA